MAPTRDREGERRGWYWLEDEEAYLFFRPEAFGPSDGTKKPFIGDTKMVILVSMKKKRNSPPEPDNNKGTQIGTLNPIGTLIWEPRGLRNPRRNLGWGDSSPKIRVLV
jgi:hypothetical protein